ncbi:uncharacterized protein LOC118734325 [Rhagoletis pomonella]|uniref:uncharacterized protein LOC118734325 n=1 Tax=Rhagoletis pomonella TaxID=28610 RepID=UPI001786B7BC|nr:uncharacterized protein LOC118734325 [Rhagoletis pomonella]
MRNLTLDGVAISVATEVKYLGLTLDSKLLWRAHVDAVTSKATRAMMVCKSLAGKSWGCTPRILRWMYTMIVKPIVTYGAVAWYSRATIGTVRQTLSKIQRLACVCITGAMRTCPTAALEVILELEPLHLSIEQAAKRTLLNFAREGFGKGKVLSSRNRDKLGTQPPPTLKLSVSLGTFHSIFQAEVYAISMCPEINIRRNYRKERILILSDSQAAVRALSSFEIKSSLVRECVERLNALAEVNDFQLMWVPGHMGVAGNEEADHLPRTAASSTPIGPDPFLAVGPNTIKEMLRRDNSKLRELHWLGTMGQRQAKSLLGGYNLSRYRLLMDLPKEKLRIITGFLTGHCKLRGHLHKLGIWSSDLCRFCDAAKETPLHLLMECDAVARRRYRSIGHVWPREEHIHSLSPGSIMKFIDTLGLVDVL